MKTKPSTILGELSILKITLFFCFTLFQFSSLPSLAQYCTTDLHYYDCSYYGQINNFTLSNLHQTGTGCSATNNAVNFTALTCSLAQGETYYFSATTDPNYTTDIYIGIWIDFNDDFDFDDGGEMLFSSPSAGNLSGSFSLPGSAVLGSHRMRVRSSYFNTVPANACDLIYFGETQDYTASVSAAPACPGLSAASVSNIGLHSADISWSCASCSGPFIVEYGLAGFIPGSGAAAGVGGTAVSATSSPKSITGLNASSEYEVYIRRNCGVNGYSGNLGPVRFTSLYDVCATLTTISCGTPVHALIPPGEGAYSDFQCPGHQNMGKERLYAFTPTVGGNYTISFSLSNYYSADYSYKKASLGCNESNWNCINSAFSDATNLIGYLHKDTTYYFLQDAFATAGVDITLQIDCIIPSTPCASPTVVSCGSPINFTVPSGAGALNIGGCGIAGNLPVGKETIYQFTPSATGSASIHVTSFSYSFPVKYFIKNANSGCNSNGWTCIGESFQSYLPIPGTLNAGTSYYILADAINYAGGSQSFEITCPETWSPCGSIASLACEVPVTAVIPQGTGAYNQSSAIHALQCVDASFIGKEIIYSFSATVSGTYALNVLNTDFINGISYLIKNASSGCNDLGWTCIGGTAYPTNLFGNPFTIPLPLVAGQTYYVMLKAFNYDGATHEFSITCPGPYFPCTSIPSVSCGVAAAVEIPDGLGAFTVNNGSFLFPGKEKIFEFTPAVTGNYLFQANDISTTEVVQYFVKVAADGCNNNNWSALANVFFGSQNVGFPYALTAGTSYYIMADGSDATQSSSQEFTVLCPALTSNPCPAITLIPGCEVPVTSVRPEGLGYLGSVQSCFGSAEPGKENIYEFIAPSSGNFALNIILGGAGSDLFFIKAASSGCNNNDWVCIAGTMALVSGTHYYILVDGYDTLGSSLTFQIECPNPDPCLSSFPVITCGYEGIDVTIPPGAGTYDVGNCNSFYQPDGREFICQFTPTVSSSYFFSANNIYSQKVYFYIKDAASGCNSSGWDCIAASSGSYIYNQALPYDLIAGNTYYIMGDNSDVYGTTFNISISCATGCELYADLDMDGFGDPGNIVYSCIPVLGYVSENTDCNDNLSSVNPLAAEVCGNSVDDNCNGQTDEGCCSPPVSITSNRPFDNICSGDNITLTVNGGTLPAGGYWIWYKGSCGGTLVSSGNASITVSPAVTTEYYAKSGGICNSACVSITVVVSSQGPVGKISIVSAPALGFVGATGVVTASTVPGAAFYRWTSTGNILFDGQPAPYESSSPTVTMTFVSLPSQGISGWSLHVFAGNGCGRTNTANARIQSTAAQPSSITGSRVACPLQTIGYSVAPVFGAASYSWAFFPDAGSPGASIAGNGSATVNVTFAALFSAGSLCVSAVTSNGTAGPYLCIHISNSAGLPGTITGNPQPCPNSSSDYSIADVDGASSYSWTLPAGATISGPVNGTSVNVNFPSVFSGNICVAASGGCGLSAASCLALIPGGAPQLSPISGAANGVCNTNGVGYEVTSANATTYSWTVGPGATITNDPGNSAILVNFTNSYVGGYVMVTASNACGTAGDTLFVSGAPGMPVIIGPTAACEEEELQYTAFSAGASSYSWSMIAAEGLIIPSSSSETVTVHWITAGGTVYATASNNCGTSPEASYLVTASTCRIAGNAAMINDLGASVYPNPTRGAITLKYNSKENSSYLLKVSDMTGRVVEKLELEAKEGINKYELDLSKVAKSLYLLSIENKTGDSVRMRVVVE